MTKDSPSLITIYENLIICIKWKFFSRTTYHVHIVHQWNQKDINTDIFSLWIQTDRYRCFGNGEYHKHSLKEQKSGLNCKRRSYVKPSWYSVNYKLQDDDDDDETMVIITILMIIIINRELISNDYHVELLSFTFSTGTWTQDNDSLFIVIIYFFNLDTVLYNATPEKLTNIWWPIERRAIRTIDFDTAWIHSLREVFATVVFVVA